MNPYINLRSYTEAYSKYFKGRDNEIAEILAILKQSDVIVLYSESAEGKSSLLGAGLTPRLRQMGYIPVNIVFTDEEFRNPNPDFDRIIIGRIEDMLNHLNEQTDQQLKRSKDSGSSISNKLTPPSYSRHANESEFYEWISTTEIDISDDNDEAKQLTRNAWWLLRNFAVERYAARFHFVLVFDQFEEVFSQPDLEWTDQLFEWLEKLYSDKCPDSVADRLLKIEAENDAFLKFNTRRSFKEIFSMRNEYIGDLDYWGIQKHFMPELKSSRYCLKPLTIGEASEVIDLGFKDNTEVKDQILSAVTGISIDALPHADANIPRVQAMLLSIICSALSQSEVDNDLLKALKAGDRDVLQRIVYDVYRSQMRDCNVSGTDRKNIEQALIDSNGKRVRIKTSTSSLKDINFDSKYKNPLKRQGIIRSSKINGEEYVEFVHDQLANAIFRQEAKSKKTRRAVASVLFVMLACIIVFALWIRSVMTFDSATIPSNRLDKYSLTLVDESIKDVLILTGNGSLENNSVVESYILKDYEKSYISILYNKSLNSLTIMPHSKNDDITIDINDDLLLKNIIIADSVRNLVINIDNNIGFCQIEIGKGTKNIKIRPRNQYTEIRSLDGSYKCVNDRWWNFNDSTIIYIPQQLKEYRFFAFPFPFSSAKYDRYDYFNIPSHGETLDLREFSQIKEIGENAFAHSLYDSVILPENLEEIKDRAFADCRNLKRIVIPASVTDIAASAFDDNCELIFERRFSYDELELNYHNTYINRLRIPQRRGTLDLSGLSHIKTIGGSAFEHSRFDSIILPDNLEHINSYAFADSRNLKRIVIPVSVKEIDKSAFDDNCEVIFKHEFSSDEISITNDTTISSLKMPQRRGTLDLSGLSQIKEIGSRAFKHSRYDSIILPESLESINYMSFAHCKNLKRIIIPASVKKIDNSAFDDSCDVVFKRDFSSDEIITRNDTLFDLIIHQRRGTLDLRELKEIRMIFWEAFAHSLYDTIILPKNIKTLPLNAFDKCNNLKRIVIPASASDIYYPFVRDNSKLSIRTGILQKKSNNDSEYVIDLYDHGSLNFNFLQKTDGIFISPYISNKYENIILPADINWFSCSDINKIFIEDKSLPELIKQKKYIKIKDAIAKLPLTGAKCIYCYNGTYFRSDSLIVANDFNNLKDIYFLGRLRYIVHYNDSSLVFNDASNLDRIESIHLSLPRPRIWTRSGTDSIFKSSIFTIDIPDSIKRGIILYVPYGSKRFYEEMPSYKAFKEIREDSRFKRYKDIIFVRFIGCFSWLKDPFNLTLVIMGILIVIAFFFQSFKMNYKKRNPYSSTMKTNILSALNGIIMGAVAVMGFMAVYWWIWDITNYNYYISALCGIVGSIAALVISYFNVLPSMWDINRKATVLTFRKLKQLF